VAALLERVGLESAHVVGTSFGALVGIVLAARWPGRVRSLVLATATERLGEGVEQGRALCAAAAREAAAGGDRAAAYDILTAAAFSPAYREAQAAVLSARARSCTCCRRPGSRAPPACSTRWPGSTCGRCCPRSAVPRCGRRGRDETFASSTRGARRGHRGARLEVVEGSGHALVVEQPETLRALVEGFLDERGGADG